MALKLGGFQKNTLIDFPGVVASLVFTQGCNFRCPYCHNPALIPFSPHEQPSLPDNSFATSAFKQKDSFRYRESLIEEAEVFTFLKKRKGLIDGVAITGGEPTLQPDLEAFCFRLKNMGLKVKVDTNGSRPKVLENLFRRELVDFIAMDIKSNADGYKYLTGGLNGVQVSSNTIDTALTFDFSLILNSIQLIINHSPAYEFRTTCIKPFVTPEIMTEIGEMIQGASHYLLQNCSQNVTMFNPTFFNNQYPFFSAGGLEELKSLVQPYVKSCSIR